MQYLITAVSFSRDFPWEFLSDNGVPERFWMEDDAFWQQIEERKVSFRAGCRLDFDLGNAEMRDPESGEFFQCIQKVHDLIEPK